MERVAQLVADEDFARALVRLWVLAERRNSAGTTLNAWERGRDASGFDAQRQSFVKGLQQASIAIPPDVIARDPLAFIRALDEVHWNQTEAGFTAELTAIEEEGRSIWLVPVTFPELRHTPLARQLNREAWFRFHDFLPARTEGGFEVDVRSARGRPADALRKLAQVQEADPRPWIAHFDDDARLEWIESAAKRFRVTRIVPTAKRRASILDTLERGARAGSRILVMPEFTVDISLREVVGGWLRTNADHPFELIVAGSFHEQTPGGWFNTAELWDRHGNCIFRHCKLRLFGEAEGLAEDVGDGNRVSVLASALGTWTLLICKDFLDQHQSVAVLLREVPVDWVLVPSYGDESTVNAHMNRARDLATVGPGTTSIVANQRNVEVSAGPACPGFAQAASKVPPVTVGAQGGFVALVTRARPPNPGRPKHLKRIK